MKPDGVRLVALALLGCHSDVISELTVVLLRRTVEPAHVSAPNVSVLIVAAFLETIYQ
jgi:hypothetical protein